MASERQGRGATETAPQQAGAEGRQPDDGPDEQRADADDPAAVRVDPDREDNRQNPHAILPPALCGAEDPEEHREQQDRDELRANDEHAGPEAEQHDNDQQIASERREAIVPQREQDQGERGADDRHLQGDQPRVAACRPGAVHHELGEPLVIHPGNVAREGVRIRAREAVSKDVGAEPDVAPEVRIRPCFREPAQDEGEHRHPDQEDAGGLRG